MQRGGSGPRLRSGWEIQILAVGSFPLRWPRIQFHLPLYFLLFQKSKPILCPSLSALVVYLKSVSFHSFTHSREHYRFYETSSFSETKAKSLIKEAGQDQREGQGGSWRGRFRQLAGRRVPRKRAKGPRRGEGAKQCLRARTGTGALRSGLKAPGGGQLGRRSGWNGTVQLSGAGLWRCWGESEVGRWEVGESTPWPSPYYTFYRQ